MKYRKQVYLGYDASGRQVRKWISADSKTELKEKILKFKLEMQQVDNPSDIVFQKYAEKWFETYKSNRAKQTQDMYRYALRKCGSIDRIPIKKITKSMCQEVINECWEHPSAAADLYDTLRQVFKTAIADGIIYRNPAEKLSLPKKPESRFHLLTEQELEAVERAKLSEQDRMLVTILQVFGLRPAEALALQPTDFDLGRRILHVTKALELSNDNRSVIKETKTGDSRDIPIPEELIAPLRNRFQANPGFLLFPKADGHLYTKSAYRRLSERILKAINIALGGTDNLNLIPGVTLYSFRHRRATDLYYAAQQGKISTKRAAYLMGHSEAIFLKTYSHIDMAFETDEIYAKIPSVNW